MNQNIWAGRAGNEIQRVAARQTVAHRAAFFCFFLFLLANLSVPARAAGYLLGNTSYTQTQNINGYTENFTASRIGYYGETDGTFPRIGDVYYMMVQVAVLGNPYYGGTNALIEFALPPNTYFAIDSVNPVQVLYYNLDNSPVTSSRLSNSEFSQTPVNGQRGSNFFRFDYLNNGSASLWPIARGRMVEIYFPVRTTRPLAGLSTNSYLAAAVFAQFATNPQDGWDAPQSGWNGNSIPQRGAWQAINVGDKPKSVGYPTLSATAVTETSASLSATVFNRYTTGDIYFDFGTTTNYGQVNSGIGIVSGNFDSQEFRSDWNDLKPGTTYHWRARYVSDGITYFGNDQTFTTSGTANVPDTTPPTIAISAPANNATVASLPAISGTASDNIGVTRVDLYVQRKSDNKFWSGTAWTTSTPISTVLNGNSWSRTTGLPSGANLAPGAYFIAARAYDAANNGTSATRNFNVASNDTTAPAIAIASPANNAVLKTLPVISGTASDNTGVTRVDLYLQRKSDNKFWNGTTWTSSTALATTLQGFAPRQWTRNSGLPSGANLASGLYFVAARAYDAANNGTSATANFIIDTNAPTVAIASPTINSTVSSFASASGATSDNGGSGVVRVEFFLRRNADNKWWNGSAWVASGVPLATSLAPIAGGQSWSISGLLPKGANLLDGSYLIGATAFDRANNSRNVNGNFTLKRTPSVASPSTVQLSSASANSDGTIRLTFTGALGASASDATNYVVSSNEQAVAITNVSQPQASTVEFDCTPLAVGARVSVAYTIEDAQGRSISGVANVVVK